MTHFNFFKQIFIFLLLCTLGCKSIDTSKHNVYSLDEAISKIVSEIEKKLEQGKRTLVAVINAETPEMSSYLIDELTAALVNGKKTNIIDRNNISHVQKELNFNMSGYVSDYTAQGIGKLVSAHYIVSGFFTKKENIAELQVSIFQAENAIPFYKSSLNIKYDESLDSLIVGIQNGYIKPVVILDRGDSFDGTDKIFNEGISYFNRVEYDRAIENFTKVITILPEYAMAYSNRGACYIRKGENQEALADINKALSIFPNYTGAYSNLAALYLEMKNTDDAISASSKTIEISPNFPDGYANRATAYAMKNEFDKALADCEFLLKLAPNWANSFIARGYVYFMKRDYNSAIQDWIKALELEPNHPNSQNIRKNIGTAAYYNTL